MKQIGTIILSLCIGYYIGHTVYSAKCSVYLKDVIMAGEEICQKQLADKHHCISFINEECGYTKKGK